MGKYIVKRVLLAIISILIVSAITFFVMNIIPGGPFNKEKATSAEAQKVLEDNLALELDYGVSIPEISEKVQNRVKSAIENMTGLKVKEVNVRVAGVAAEEV